MSYVLRVVLPDRPGSLGAVSSALGRVGADILALDSVERSFESAVDDIVVDLPSGKQPDVLITAAETVPGVRVESVRPDPGVDDSRCRRVDRCFSQPHCATLRRDARSWRIREVSWSRRCSRSTLQSS